MRILLITNYWAPDNHPGTFRWLNFGKYIDFDVLTTLKIKGFNDASISGFGHRVHSVPVYNNYACLHGLFLAFNALRYKADIYIVTCPPESLLFAAYLLQKNGKKVIIDMRDAINRPWQPLKFMIPIYSYFYMKLKNVIVAWQFIDTGKPCIHHGHDNLFLRSRDMRQMPIGRHSHVNYNNMLQNGYIPDFSSRSNGYVTSSFINIKHLWQEKSPVYNFHSELLNLKPYSWEAQAKKMESILLKA